MPPVHSFGEAVLWSVVFGIVGITMLIVGYKVFDFVTPGIDVEKELAEKNNIAVAIVVGALFLAIAWVVSTAIG
jgi:putative membrane protein